MRVFKLAGLDFIKALKKDGLTQEKIGEKLGWSEDQVKNYSALQSSIVPNILNLHKIFQQGRGTEEVPTVTFNFTEGWFRNSGLYDLRPGNCEGRFTNENEIVIYWGCYADSYRAMGYRAFYSSYFIRRLLR